MLAYLLELDTLTDEIVLVGGDSPKRELIVWIYRTKVQAICSLLRLRLFSAAGQFAFSILPLF